jgi:hypothetical protein
MKRSIFAGMLVLGASAVSPALAADLPVPVYPKAPAVVLDFYSGSGLYGGFNVKAEGGTANVNSLFTSSGTLNPTGGIYGLTMGWQKGNGTSFFALEVMADKNNVRAGDPCAMGTTTLSCSLQGNWEFEGRVKFGGQLATLLNYLPNNPFGTLAPPGLPDVVGATGVAPNMHPYLFAGGLFRQQTAAIDPIAEGKDWTRALTWGPGFYIQTTKTTVLDIWAERVEQSKGLNLGSTMPVPLNAAAGNGPSYRVGAALLVRFGGSGI